VTDAQADFSQDLTRRELLERWNTLYPDWTYPPRLSRDEVRIFWRDYTRVKQRFLFPAAIRSARPLRPPVVGPERTQFLFKLGQWLTARVKGLFEPNWVVLLEEWNSEFPEQSFRSGDAEQQLAMFRSHYWEARTVVRDLSK